MDVGHDADIRLRGRKFWSVVRLQIAASNALIGPSSWLASSNVVTSNNFKVHLPPLSFSNSI